VNALQVVLNHPKYPNSELTDSISAILSANELCAIATVMGGGSYIHTAYYAYSSNLEFYYLSQPSDQHSQNIEQNESVAIAVWNKPDKWSENLQGVQVFGRCKEVGPGRDLVEGMKLFLQQFHDFSKVMKSPGRFMDGITLRMYMVRPRSLKLIDEPRFGRRNFIVVQVS
jgi:nitroimidazol reductase NimA-like FMN-containing flavoprotein (pyridoxamine 5'-phosphate oxidase superfamily)